MKNKYFFQCCIFFLVFTTQAQSPTLQWAKSMGTGNPEKSMCVAVDLFGNVYTTGYFYGTADFDPGPGTFTLTSANADVFISKLDANGNFVWAKRMGGINTDVATSIAIDGGGNIYVTGSYKGVSDFDPGPGTFLLASVGASDVFVSKLNPSGNFVWAKSMGGTGNDNGFSVALDAFGNIYTTGDFQDTSDFDPSPLVFTLFSTGASDVFISKLNAKGDFVWAKGIVGTSGEASSSIALDASGNVYTTGIFDGTADFDPNGGTFNLTSEGYLDIFISKLSASGNFLWAKSMGGTNEDNSYAIAIDNSGNVCCTGYFRATADFDPGPSQFTLSPVWAFDCFVSKLDSMGNFLWAKSFGDIGQSIAIDGTGNIYTTGYFFNVADFDPGPGILNLTSTGYGDAFVSKLDPGGNLIWALNFGGDNFNWARAIALDASNNIYTTGMFQGTTDFDFGAGICNLTSVGQSNHFVQKINQSVSTIVKAVPTNNYFLSVYPNPNNGIFQLQIENEIKNGEIILINYVGQKVYVQNISQGVNEIITNGLSSGLYNYILLQDHQKIKDGKLIIN